MRIASRRLASLLAFGFALGASLSLPARASDDLVMKPSKHSVGETIDKLAKVLESKGIGIVARVDHAAGAEKAGMSLKPMQLLIFGNPKLGTPLMQSKRTIGLDLPMKVLAWEDDKGNTWVAYTKPAALKARHGIINRDKVFETMTGALAGLTKAATQ